MKKITAGKNDAGQRLDKYITKSFPLLPQSLMYKYIRSKRIKVNGKRSEISYRLKENDVISLYINDEFFVEVAPKYDFLSSPIRLNIVYEDENIILADKEQGLIVHPDKNEYRDTLIGRIQHYLYDKGEYKPDEENSFKPALANRIDRNTGGIVIAAKNAEALRILCDKIKDREIDKQYLAVIHGVPKEKSATLEGFLEKNEDKNRVYLKKNREEGALTIRTRYRTLMTRDNLSLIEVDLLTGRTHQIRVHLASIGHPLLGDPIYGGANTKFEAKHKDWITGQCLHAKELTFTHPKSEKEVHFTSPLPVLFYQKESGSVQRIGYFAELLQGE